MNLSYSVSKNSNFIRFLSIEYEVKENKLASMEPRLEQLVEKKMIGKKLVMSLTNNLTGALWAGFMPRRKEVQNTLSSDLYSLQFYPPSYFEAFDLATPFEKWAAVEVSNWNGIPEGMEILTIPAGLYAVFHYKGLSTDTTIFQYIYTTWLPTSGYALDNRPHFEVLGEKYRNGDPDSEEEIWIPIKQS